MFFEGGFEEILRISSLDGIVGGREGARQDDSDSDCCCVAGCLLVTCLCCYITSCCYLSLDCCSDPYWGCCPWCLPCVPGTRPPHHTKVDSADQTRPDESRYSLNENNGAPRTRGSARSINSNNNRDNKVGQGSDH